jgi:hypothetical protein
MAVSQPWPDWIFPAGCSAAKEISAGWWSCWNNLQTNGFCSMKRGALS